MRLLKSFIARRKFEIVLGAFLAGALLLGGLLGIERPWQARQTLRMKPNTLLHRAKPAARKERARQPALFLSALPPSLARAHFWPNEVGAIPILMYHAIGAPAHHGSRYDRHGLNISPEAFRKQLALMYKAGWFPVNMRDVLTARIDVPAGKTPVVLTFDDARESQFRYQAEGAVDPNCAVGILLAFHASHPTWPLRATFYVLPRSQWNPVPFWQPGLETRKLRFLVAQGFEVANHSTSHRLMCHMDRRTLEWEMAQATRSIQASVPEATMDTMALPGGGAPQNHALWPYLLQGRDGLTRYRNRCVLMAWGGPARCFIDRAFDPLRVHRIGVMPGYMEGWLRRLQRGRVAAYISDGNPNTVMVPRFEARQVAMNRLNGANLIVYGVRSGKNCLVKKGEKARRTKFL